MGATLAQANLPVRELHPVLFQDFTSHSLRGYNARHWYFSGYTMRRQDFYFDLPPELIAQYPLSNRSDSRLLAYNRQEKLYRHHAFKTLPQLLEPGDLLVMNDTRVIPARFFGSKESGGKVEFLLERRENDQTFLAHIKAGKSPKPGAVIALDKGWMVQILAKIGDLYHCQASGDLDSLLQEVGHVPLPPYITRADENLDEARYQTVYARYKGSVAAPTAGLHFDQALLAALQERGVDIAWLTLHVGAGTFRPVRCEAIQDHKMHPEQFSLSPATCDAVNKARAEGRRVIAVGTTTLRSLESAADNGMLVPVVGIRTSLFTLDIASKYAMDSLPISICRNLPC